MKLNSVVTRTALLLVTMSPLILAGSMIVYVFLNGAPIIASKGLNFVLGMRWDPSRDIYGVFPMLIGSGAVTLVALTICLPFSLSVGVFLSEYLRSWPSDLVRYLLFTFAGIPPVVYGFFGLVVVVPFIREHLGGPGYSIIAASITLALMILPTLSIAIETALFNVPVEYREAALACSGATRLQAIRHIVLPIAKPGIFAGIFLGLGRVLGETTAVLLITGNVAALPTSVTSPVRTLTANIALELSEATGEHRQAIFASAFILTVLIIVLNWVTQTLVGNQR
jgi:phosphate transport system permease protein